MKVQKKQKIQKPELKETQNKTDSGNTQKPDSKRIPIVSILGHVDHGKTSILDAIRKTNVVSGEAGGITQKISVFTVDAGSGQKITFIDTPGHEAFDLMRVRGGVIADIVLLVVAANDGLKPQTIESIEIIKAAGARPIVVFNKVDLPDVDIEKIKRELVKYEIYVEGYGGDIPYVQVSAKTGQGIAELLETIALKIQVEGFIERGELPKGTLGKAFVLESIKDKSQGYVSSIVMTDGEVDRGSWLAYRAGKEIKVERIKGFIGEDGSRLEKLSAGSGGKLIGIADLLSLGSEVYVLPAKNEKLAEELFPAVEASASLAEALTGANNQDNELFDALFAGEKSEDEVKKLNVIIKSSSEGSLEAIKKLLGRIEVEEYIVNIQSAAVGDISTSDIELAALTKSVILGFEVGRSNGVDKLAETKRVLIRDYDVIYKIADELEDTLEALTAPAETEEEIGEAELKKIFILSNGNKVLGGKVTSGSVKKNSKVYVVRNDEIIGEGKILSMKSGKNEVSEAGKGAEFGIIISPTPADVQEGDEIHCFKVIRH